jgi:4'-phosphopantetheinyl transferase
VSYPLAILEIDCRWSQDECQAQLPLLPEEIQGRARRYLSASSRRNLIASRGRLREVLELLGLRQGQVTVAGNGRPYHLEQALQFNLSHSHERAVLALSTDPGLVEGLGVDVEWTGRSVDTVAIGQRFFTHREHLWVGSDVSRFFHVWTRKEAILKSNGIGLRVELDSFDVLSDQVGHHVTGRPLRVGTQSRDHGYLVSWATSAEPAQIHLLQDWQEGWQERVVELLAMAAGKE